MIAPLKRDSEEEGMAERDTPPPVKNTVEGRQGVTGHNVRYVLAAALIAVILAFCGLWLYYFH